MACDAHDLYRFNLHTTYGFPRTARNEFPEHRITVSTELNMVGPTEKKKKK